MASRRWVSMAPKPPASGGDSQVPWPSGPRCTIASLIRWRAARLGSPMRPMIPAIPHIDISCSSTFAARKRQKTEQCSSNPPGPSPSFISHQTSGGTYLRAASTPLELAYPLNALPDDERPRSIGPALSLAVSAQPADVRRTAAHAGPDGRAGCAPRHHRGLAHHPGPGCRSRPARHARVLSGGGAGAVAGVARGAQAAPAASIVRLQPQPRAPLLRRAGAAPDARFAPFATRLRRRQRRASVPGARAAGEGASGPAAAAAGPRRAQHRVRPRAAAGAERRRPGPPDPQRQELAQGQAGRDWTLAPLRRRDFLLRRGRGAHPRAGAVAAVGGDPELRGRGVLQAAAARPAPRRFHGPVLW